MTKHPRTNRSYFNSHKLSPLMSKHKLVADNRETFDRTLYIGIILSFVKITSHLESQFGSSEKASVTHQDIMELVETALPC